MISFPGRVCLAAALLLSPVHAGPSPHPSDRAAALRSLRAAAAHFAARGESARFDATLRRLLDLQGEIAGVRLPGPAVWRFPDVIEAARRRYPRNPEGLPYDATGLAYPLRQLDAEPVLHLPPGQLQRYVDVVTRAYPDATFLRTVSQQACATFPAAELNTTVLADMAYVSLQARIPANRAEAARCLDDLLGLWRRWGGR